MPYSCTISARECGLEALKGARVFTRAVEELKQFRLSVCVGTPKFNQDRGSPGIYAGEQGLQALRKMAWKKNASFSP